MGLGERQENAADGRCFVYAIIQAIIALGMIDELRKLLPGLGKLHAWNNLTVEDAGKNDQRVHELINAVFKAKLYTGDEKALQDLKKGKWRECEARHWLLFFKKLGVELVVHHWQPGNEE